MLSEDQRREVVALRAAGMSYANIAKSVGVKEHHVKLALRIEIHGIEKIREDMRRCNTAARARERAAAEATGPLVLNCTSENCMTERHAYRTPRQIIDRTPTAREMIAAFARGDIPKEQMLAAIAPGFKPVPGLGAR